MNRRFYVTLLACCCSAVVASAQPKDVARMTSTARQALLATGAQRAAQAEPRELRALRHCSVVGYDGGQFAVVSADGRQLLGVSTARSSEGRNPAFEWWLKATDAALARQSAGKAYQSETIRPNPKKFPIQVGPLMTTHWGQMDPYNRKCPVGGGSERCAVGCVATSLAQVLNYHQTPERGEGVRTVYYPYQDSINGTPVTVDFADVTYRWDLTHDVANFRYDAYTDEQADAISTLLLHMGVAADMRYDVEAAGGSATTAAAAAEGLRKYLHQPNAQVLFRENYEEEDWMDLVFGEISSGHPVIYGGQSYAGGHSFVLHGYNRDGLVYVNWGWNGDDEGYYSINLLNPGAQAYVDAQDMIVGINTTEVPTLAASVTLTEAGTMSQRLADVQLADYCHVTVSGPMNDADFQSLRDSVLKYRVTTLDLTEAQFDALPERALYGCSQLQTLRLPRGLKHIGDGALGGLFYLTDVELQPADDADFVVDGHLIYNNEQTEIISALPTISGELVVPATVTAIHPYAFSGCVLLERVELPAAVTTLGAETFRNCFWLEQLKVRSKTAIELKGYDIFDGVDMTVCTLLVPSGLKNTYSRRAQWNSFNDIQEFGTTVKASNAVRKVGEDNPEFRYSITGDPVTGTPELYTDATKDSPEGVYTIFVMPGTITDPEVEYVNGKLTIVPNPDAIDDVTVSDPVTAVFDLGGRRVVGQRQGGLYIERTASGKTVKRFVR